MAIYKVINKSGCCRTAQDVEHGIRYIASPWKVEPDGVFCGAVFPSCAVEAMEAVTNVYHNHEGVRLRHTVLSFASDEDISIEEIKEIAQKCISYYSDEYQIVAGVHEDETHFHIHFGMNTTSYVDGFKYKGDKKDLYDFQDYINQVLHPYGTGVRIAK